MAAEPNSTPSPDATTDPVVTLVACWHEIQAAMAAANDPAEQDRLMAEARDVERKIAVTRATSVAGALAGLELLLVDDTGIQAVRGSDHQSALYLALIQSAAGVMAAIIAPARQQLFYGLKFAADCFDSIPDDGRIGAMITLKTAYQALRSLSVPEKHLRPIWVLLLALEDAENGKPNPMLKPEKVSNRPSDERVFVADKARAAVAMTLLMDGGYTEDQAASYVYEKVRKWTALKSRKFTPQTIAYWRFSANGGREADELLRYAYVQALKDARSRNDNPVILAKNLLSSDPMRSSGKST